jgi:hypothetical protein
MPTDKELYDDLFKRHCQLLDQTRMGVSIENIDINKEKDSLKEKLSCIRESIKEDKRREVYEIDRIIKVCDISNESINSLVEKIRHTRTREIKSRKDFLAKSKELKKKEEETKALSRKIREQDRVIKNMSEKLKKKNKNN